MSIEREHIVIDIVQAAGDRLVSRIRLQKTAYLLDQLGAKSGFEYTYHHYGPYSRDLDNAIEDAKAFELLEEEIGRRNSDGATYSIFKKMGKESPRFLEDAKLRELVESWTKVPILVLELAATAHWLSEHEKVKDWKTEIKRRKGSKTEDGRLEKAVGLLEDIGLTLAIHPA